MSVNSTIKAALSPILPVEADTYEGKKEVYSTFAYDTIPADFGDDEPGAERYLVSVHLFAPTGHNTLAVRTAIKKALRKAGATYPSETNASDKNGQHIVFECEMASGVEEVE